MHFTTMDIQVEVAITNKGGFVHNRQENDSLEQLQKVQEPS